MKLYEVNVKRLRKIIGNGNNITLVYSNVGKEILSKSFGKYKTIDNNREVKKVNKKNIENIRVGDLYFNEEDIKINTRKR